MMMDDNNNGWKDGILNSMKNSRKASLRPELFAKIESAVNRTESRIVPLFYIRIAAAAAIMLLVFNFSVVSNSLQSEGLSIHDMEQSNSSNQSLISNYIIY